MKYLFFLITKATIFTIIISSCNSDKNNFKNNALENSSVDSISSTKLIDTENKDSVCEKNLRNSLIEYWASIENGDLNKAYLFFYSGALKNFKKKFPQEHIDDAYIKEKLLIPTYKILNLLKDKAKANPQYVLHDIVLRTKYQGTLIYVINTSLDATVKGKQMSMKSKTICISEDKGLHWTFMELDKSISEEILTSDFDNNITRQVLSLIESNTSD